MPEPRVVIVGGGVAGLSLAYFLQRGGAAVTVLESNRMGSGASSANAGWICPGQAGPLPEPGLAAYGVRSLMSRDSALYFAPAYLPGMVAWLARFVLRCNERDHRRGTAAIAQLARRTFPLIELLAGDGVEFDLHRRGLVVAARNRDGAAAFLAGMQPLREVGFKVPDRVLQAAELHDLEPALAGSVSAGILLEEHWHVHAPPFMRALASRLADLGVRLEEGAEVSEVVSADGRVSEVRSTAGGFPADAVVLAAGAWSARLARDLGFAPPPVRPGKGYSFEVDMQTLPRHALLLLEPHVGCSPLGDRLRIAGTMEFSGVNARVDERRIEAIVRGAAGMLRGIDSPKVNDLRSGMRPIAPDGLPIIDRVPGYANAYIATAYSMLGMTLAAPAAEALAEFVLTGRRPPQLEPFAATRFRSPIALARRHAGRSAARQYARRRIGRSS